MKRVVWRVCAEEENHVVSYAFVRLKGKITVTIDGESFDLPAGFLGLGAAKREIFRLGDEQAVLAVDKKGDAQLLFQGAAVPPCNGTEENA